MEDIFKASAEYAARGWRVLRINGLAADGRTCTCRNGYSCGTPGKHPVDREWQVAATTDEDTIAEWFDAGASYNVGVALGEASGIIDIEWDDEAGKATAEKFGLTTIDTPTYQSHRSEHRLFKYDPRLPQQAVVKLSGLEIRIGGGDRGAQSVFPPSLHASGVRYRWKYGFSPDDVEAAEIPEVLMQAIMNQHGGGSQKQPTEALLHSGVSSGERHTSMVRLIAYELVKMIDPHDPQEQQRSLLVSKALNRTVCSPPLDDKEIEGIWRGQLRWAIKVRAAGGGPSHLKEAIEAHEKSGFAVDGEAAEDSPPVETPFTLTGLEFRGGEWFPGQWRLKVVHGHPVSYTLTLPVYSNGQTRMIDVTLNAEQYRSASKVAQAVLEATHTVILDEVPEEWGLIWAGRGKRKGQAAIRGLKAKLMDVANQEIAAAEAMRFAKVAEWFLASITSIPAPRSEDKDGEPDANGRPAWVRSADGEWELWFSWSLVWEDVDKGRRRIQEGEQADLKRRILAITGEADFPKARHTVEGGVKRRYIRWTEKHIRALERLASGDVSAIPSIHIGKFDTHSEKVGGKVGKWSDESEVLANEQVTADHFPDHKSEGV